MSLIPFGHNFADDNFLLGFAGDDVDLLSLVAALALEDIEDIQSHAKGKGRYNAGPSDADIAMQLYAEEASQLLAYSKDAALAQSMDSAISSDRRVLAELVDEEISARHDREMAVALSEGRQPPPRTSVGGHSTQQSGTTSSSSNKPLTIQGPSSSSKTAAASEDVPEDIYVRNSDRRECAICGDRITTLGVYGPCSEKHPYCMKCLKELFTHATSDESLFPPRCCKVPFPVDAVGSALGRAVMVKFNKKALEFSTTNRVYCRVPTCSEFLGAATHTITISACPECLSLTCTRCKSAAHGLVPCDDEQDREVLALGASEGWKRCPACHQLIELAYGCYHMTCRCRKEFCYVCAETWKTCRCEQWDESRLVVAAEDRARRLLPPGGRAPVAAAPAPAAAFQWQNLVRCEVENLRVNHECQHRRWRHRHGAGTCETCGHFLPIFLLECAQCHIFACVRCTRNRL